MSLMAALDNDTISLLVAISSDEKKAARLSELQTAMAELAAAQAKLEEERQAQAAENKAALEDRGVAEKLTAALADRSAELDAREAKMAEVQAGIQAEHQKWETEVRQPVTKEQADALLDLQTREQVVTARKEELDEASIRLREARNYADGIIGHYSGMIAELLAVLEKQKALPGAGLDPES